jgi:hypothetical protein
LDPGVLPMVYVSWVEPETMIDIYVERPPWDQGQNFLWIMLTLGLLVSMGYAIWIFLRAKEMKVVQGIVSFIILVASWYLYALLHLIAPDIGTTGFVTIGAMSILLALLPLFISTRVDTNND